MEMDMDVDIDIPLQEELEYLESHIQDDFYDEDLELPTEPYPEDEEQEQNLEAHHPQTHPNHQPTKPILSIPPKPTSTTHQSSFPETQTNDKKRFRSDCPESLIPENVGPFEDKRIRLERDDPASGIDEDWLRYSPPRGNEGTNVEEPVVVEEEKIVSRYASQIEGDFVPVTGLGGERVYAKICRVEKEDRLKKLDVRAYSNGLIQEPISVLIQRVENDAFTKALQTSVEGANDVVLPEILVANEQLWVDKYAPKSFVELLSDEHTNREVLLWLKQWDSCVFGSEIKSTTEDVLSALRRHSSVSQHQKPSNWSSFGKSREFRSSKGNFKVHNDLNQGNNDSNGIQELWNKKCKGFGPPEQKILLLCGPPGLGKTTLAHVAAMHCGYHVVEINASDDRSSSSIEAKILDVVQMNSVMADSKPKCLVIDEIDGALGDGKGAVEVILKMVSADRKYDAGKENIAQEEKSGRNSSKKKQKSASLLRPVICICNDLYAPALRPLRQVAKVHIFVQPTVSRVVSRLKYICNKEGLKTSSIVLTTLTEYTDCDIRSCLNTLQFLNKKKKTLNVLEISSQVVGRKDTSKSVFEIWKEVFQKRRVKHDRKSVNGCCSTFEFLHSLISNRGDYDLILDGIHENLLQLNYHDPVMQKTVKCLHSLEVSDIIHQYIMRTQQMSLLVYQPPIAIAVHGLIARVEKPNIEWPKSFHRYRTILMEKMEILRSWHNKISPCISRHLSTKSFVEDSISPLLHVLSPPTLRPVALNLLSEKDKNDVVQLVNTMVSYAITYKNMKSDPLHGSLKQEAALDASKLSFDPPIGDFINFKGYASDHFVLTLAVKQVLVHEVEKQRILQGSINRSTNLTAVCNKENQALTVDGNGRAQCSRSYGAPLFAEKEVIAKNPSNVGQYKLTDTSLDPSTNATASAKQKFPENKKKPSNGSFSFFDRFRKVSSKGSQNATDFMQKSATTDRDSRPLLFKFNEGFTNAVKRPVRIHEFLI